MANFAFAESLDVEESAALRPFPCKAAGSQAPLSMAPLSVAVFVDDRNAPKGAHRPTRMLKQGQIYAKPDNANQCLARFRIRLLGIHVHVAFERFPRPLIVGSECASPCTPAHPSASLCIPLRHVHPCDPLCIHMRPCLTLCTLPAISTAETVRHICGQNCPPLCGRRCPPYLRPRVPTISAAEAVRHICGRGCPSFMFGRNCAAALGDL